MCMHMYVHVHAYYPSTLNPHCNRNACDTYSTRSKGVTHRTLHHVLEVCYDTE